MQKLTLYRYDQGTPGPATFWGQVDTEDALDRMLGGLALRAGGGLASPAIPRPNNRGTHWPVLVVGDPRQGNQVQFFAYWEDAR